ncbi:MAG: hypothetical protein LBT01_06040, partial [Spirochaetaceae bacterium]|nr:hypothetical protein [Spirochaetaceae bacterium]
MKDSYRLIFFFCAVFLFSSCGNEKNAETNAAYVDEGGYHNDADYIDIDSGASYANAEAVKAAFTLDYRPENPEPEQAADVLSAGDLFDGG